MPRFAAARAIATSPSGCTACTPVGEIKTGMDNSWPITETDICRCIESPATCGAKPNWSNESRLSRMERPFSDPAMSAP
ncbi:unannotated protein [freshwater metagenome]|uniref:Unannotated protein n=1 Tax=freshwater metagenome TaxID=449393 RepID=A0A6J6K7R2_9ZZZZ